MTNEERERRDGISVGEAWRGRRFTIGEALGRGLDAVVADVAAAVLIERGRTGGDVGAQAVRELIETSKRAARTMHERAVRAERLAAQAAADNGPKGRATLMAQAILLPVPNPPEGHLWVTSMYQDAPDRGSLYCVTCTPGRPFGAARGEPGRVVTASECLITAMGT